MGLLALGTPLTWPEVKKVAGKVREWGIEQLLATWRRAKDKEGDVLLWGDEIEYLVVCMDDTGRHVRLSLHQMDILKALAEDEELHRRGGGVPGLQDTAEKDGEVAPTFHPEFGRFMLEATPGKPWGIDFADFLKVEKNMRLRRKIAKEHMSETEFPITMTTFPLMGLPDTLVPDISPSGERLRSQYVPDEIANPHIRFPTLAANIRERRGRKVEVNVPVFHDTATPWPFYDPTVNYSLYKWPEDSDVRNDAVKKNHIYMDAMAFGMGSCCLQITFQAKNIDEGRKMYDQLSPLGPIMLALTAATPIYKGFLADTDVRWNQISRAVDDRTPEELGEAPLKRSRWRIPKSRYASNSTYISQDPRLRPEYFDPNLVYDPALKQRLMEGGMDSLLATHFAHLFIRDPIVVFNEDLEQLDLSKVDHFENLQSTNWQHMRFKPPPPGNDTGWRVEFRSMEIQLTDFENAAFAIFIVLVTRAILSFDLNFYIPIQRTEENMETAHVRDAVNTQRFWFRKEVLPETPSRAPTPPPSQDGGYANGTSTNDDTQPPAPAPAPAPAPVKDEYTLMSINEIINGTSSSSSTDPTLSSSTAATNGTSSTGPRGSISESGFPGLLPLVETYLDSLNITYDARCAMKRYLELIRRRADGSLWTGARWIRDFVRRHAEYKGDSRVGSGIAYDLCKAVLDTEDVVGVDAGWKREGWEMFGGGKAGEELATAVNAQADVGGDEDVK